MNATSEPCGPEAVSQKDKTITLPYSNVVRVAEVWRSPRGAARIGSRAESMNLRANAASEASGKEDDQGVRSGQRSTRGTANHLTGMLPHPDIPVNREFSRFYHLSLINLSV